MDLKESLNNAASNAKYLVSNRLNTIDSIKRDSRNVLDRYKRFIDINNFAYKTDFKSHAFTDEDVQAYVKLSVFNETNQFYDTHVRTNVLKNITKKVTSKVLDNYNVYKTTDKKENAKIVTDIALEIDGSASSYKISNKNYEKMVRNLVVTGKIYLVAYTDIEGNIVFSTKQIYQVKPNEFGFDILKYVKGQPTIERRTLVDGVAMIQTYKIGKYGALSLISEEVSPFSALTNQGVYLLSIDEIVTMGVVELTMIYGQLWANVDKEIVLSALQLFADRGYIKDSKLRELQDFYVPVNTPDTSVKLGEGGRPLFEVYSPNLRSGALKEMRDLVHEELATSLMLDRASLGLETSETATSDRIRFGASTDTINQIKADVQDTFTKFLQDFLKDETYYIFIEKYQVNDPAQLIANATKAYSDGTASLRTSIEMMHPDWDEKDVLKELLAIKEERGLFITDAETEEAKELNLTVSGTVEI